MYVAPGPALGASAAYPRAFSQTAGGARNVQVGSGFTARVAGLEVATHPLENDDSFYFREDGVILAHADIYTGVEVRPALANDDVTGDNQFTTISLHAKALCVAIASVTA